MSSTVREPDYLSERLVWRVTEHIRYGILTSFWCTWHTIQSACSTVSKFLKKLHKHFTQEKKSVRERTRTRTLKQWLHSRSPTPETGNNTSVR